MSDDCDDIKFFPPSDKLGGDKPVPSCLPNILRPVEELQEPTVIEEQEPDLRTPRSLRVYNRQVERNCPEGSNGPSVRIEAREMWEDVPFSRVLAIPEHILDYLAGNDAILLEVETRIEQSDDFNATDFAQLTAIPYAHADALLAILRETQALLTATADALLESQLSCYWVNDTQSAVCSDPAMARPVDHDDAVYEVTVPAGIVKSYRSKDDANSKALAQAEAALNCFYVSDTYIADCTTRPDRPSPVMEAVPVDANPVYQDIPKRVGTYTVLKGVFKSLVSKQDANTQAQTFGNAQLVCFYVNDPVFKKCEDATARNIGVDPAEHPAQEADPATYAAGQFVTIPRGYIMSDLSTSAATAEATNLADSLIQCCYVNKPLYVECPPFELLHPDGSPVLDEFGQPTVIPASQTASEVWSYTIAAGTWTSCESQEAADTLARIAIDGELQCAYCNKIVLPTCVPSWVITAVTSGIKLDDGSLYQLTLPIDPTALINPYTQEPEDISKWSVDATLGLGADTFCSMDFIQSQQLAEAAGADKVINVLDSDDCVFENDLVIAACAAEDPFVPGSKYQEFTGMTPSGEVYHFFSKFSADTCVDAELSNPGPGNTIQIAAGTVKLTVDDIPQGLLDPALDMDYKHAFVKEYANTIAKNMATSLLYCAFTNPDTVGICEAVTYPAIATDPESGREDGSRCAGPWIIGAAKPSYQLSVNSNNALNPLKVPRGSFVSTVSLEEVYDLTYAFVVGQLYCMYCNEPQQASCPNGSFQLSSAIVPPCTYQAITLAEANRQAKLLAVSMVACAGDAMIGPPGPAGQDGECTGGGCSGNCYGVYS